MALGLPDEIRALLFDLDGVLTQTAKVHQAAWKQMFDEYLRERAVGEGAEFREFSDDDYNDFVDGKPRADGVRSFLESRGIGLPEGSPEDPPAEETVAGLGNRKNELVLRLIDEQGVDVFDDSVAYTKAAIEAGLRRAVVSSSANCRAVLESAGIIDLFEEIVDGNVAAEKQLAGKPAPDTFAYAAKRLGAEKRESAVFEDALAGVEAGRAGSFGCVVGVNRLGDEHARDLKEHGADLVVARLTDLPER